MGVIDTATLANDFTEELDRTVNCEVPSGPNSAYPPAHVHFVCQLSAFSLTPPMPEHCDPEAASDSFQRFCAVTSVRMVERISSCTQPGRTWYRV